MKKLLSALFIVALAFSSQAAFAADDQGLHLKGMEKEQKKAAIEAKKSSQEAEKAAKKAQADAEKAAKKAEKEAKKAAKKAKKN